MSAPTSHGTATALPFEQRLVLVREAVEQRISDTQTENPFATRAKLWVQWLKRNVLDVPVMREVGA